MSVATATELWRLSATDLAQAIRSRHASSREVVEAHLRRIEAVNPAVNAVTVVLAEPAVEAAEAADRTVADGDPLPPFHGVPFTVKGNIDLVGTPTTHGAMALVGAYPTLDAPVVERLKAAGVIPIGHTNLPTFALRWHTDSELYGPTINPWDRSRTAGASSAGEAAALATGMSPLGLGNDGLGSLRHPAQCCGVSVLKPTLGRIPDATITGPADAPIGAQLTDVQGPLARRIADLRAALELLAGPTWRDPWTVPAPLRGPEVELVRRWFNGEFTPKEWYRIFLRIGGAYFHNPSLRVMLGEVIRGGWRAKVRPEAQIFAFRHLLKGWTVMDRLGEITVPTLVMAGRDDFVFPPECQRELAAGIPNARLRLIERAGHNPHVEQPIEVMQAVSDFISTDVAAPATEAPTVGR
jgi:pimeloyl-ACP methyl ester carboxylesterase